MVEARPERYPCPSGLSTEFCVRVQKTGIGRLLLQFGPARLGIRPRIAASQPNFIADRGPNTPGPLREQSPRAQRPAPSELDRIVVSHAGELRLGLGGMFDSCRNW